MELMVSPIRPARRMVQKTSDRREILIEMPRPHYWPVIVTKSTRQYPSGSVAGLNGWAPTLGQLGATGTQIANTSIQVGSAVGSVATPAIAHAIIGNAAWAVPVVGAAIAGITLAITAWVNRMGPKQKTWTTQIVNEIEPYMLDNLNSYLEGPRTRSSQELAIYNFHTLWDQVVTACSNPQMGEPGQRCINDRKEGSTKGYDWWKLYLDPIRNDPNVVPDPTSADKLLAGTGTAEDVTALLSGWGNNIGAAFTGASEGKGLLFAGVGLIMVGLLVFGD